MKKLWLLALAVLLLGVLALFPFNHHGSHHSVTLTWKAAVEQPGQKVVSYNIYRSTTSGGPYAPLTSGIKGLTYEDELVNPGTTYYYVVKSVDQSGHESTASQEVRVTVPGK